MPHLLIIPWHFALQQREIMKNISQGISKVFNMRQSHVLAAGHLIDASEILYVACTEIASL
jgi:hypothetical protein